MLEDSLKHTELIIHWGNDPDTTHGIYGGNESAQWRLWLRDKGVTPDLPRPLLQLHRGPRGRQVDRLPARHHLGAGRGHRLRVARPKAPTTRSTSARKTFGFDEFKAYILGESDGVPKTPPWAAEITDVPARTIVALAREWASHRTCSGRRHQGRRGRLLPAGLRHRVRPACWCFLQAMQGLGKPGVSIWGTANGPPYNHTLDFPGYASGGGFNLMAEKPAINPVKQRLYRLTVPEAILDPPHQLDGRGLLRQHPSSSSSPSSTTRCPGYSEVKMFYRYGGAFLATMTDTNKWVRMYQSPKLEFVVNQDCWFSTETRLADVILPACTNLERDDISEWASSGGYSLHASGSANHRVIIYQQKCVEPVGESKPDYEIFCELAERLGVNEEYTEGNTLRGVDREDVRQVRPAQVHGLRGVQEEGLLRRPADRGLQAHPGAPLVLRGPGVRHARHRQPQARHRQRPTSWAPYSGKIEFVSQSLKATHARRRRAAAAAAVHPQLGRPRVGGCSRSTRSRSSRRTRGSPSTRTTTTTCPGSRRSPGTACDNDGYDYWVVRVHPEDAEPRGIKHGDIVELYNDRGVGPLRRPRDREGQARAWSTPTRERPGTTRSSRARPAAPTGAAA